MDTLEIRRAEPEDAVPLRRLQECSLNALGRAYYDADVIEAFIATIGLMDDVLIEDGTFFTACLGGEPVGCGGWSLRRPGYETLTAATERRDIPTVRSVFVHPDHARRGIARLLMHRIEGTIEAAGHERASLAATLSGVPLYRHMGYRSIGPVGIPLPHGRFFTVIKMEKRLAGVLDPAA